MNRIQGKGGKNEKRKRLIESLPRRHKKSLFLVSSCIGRIMIFLLFAKDSYSLFSFLYII